MNIDLIRERALLFGTIIASIVLAIYAGKLVANEQYGTLGLIFAGGFVTIVTLVARERAWMGALIFWPLIGRTELLPLPFSWRELGVLATAGMVAVLVAFRVIRTRPKFSALDALLWINVLWLIFTFVRNPTGTQAMNSERVGGRPYFECAVAFVAYLVLSRSAADAKSLRRMTWYIFGMVFAVFSLHLILMRLPQLVSLVSKFYSEFNALEAQPGVVQSVEDSEFRRYGFFVDLGKYGVTLLCSYFVPATLLSPLYIWRFLALAGLMAGLLLSGFRSFVAYAGCIMVLATYFHRGAAAAVKMLLLGAVALLILMLGHGSLYRLPFAAQRALAFIPEPLRVTQLDRIAIEDGEGTTEWRVEMWRDAITTNLYIKNKTYGDGFGITRQQASEAGRLIAFGTDYRTAQSIVAMYGDFHSGPIATIRVVGYVGLALMGLALIFTAKRGAKMIRSAKGTPFFQPALFIGLPVVFELFWYFLVYGHHYTGFFAISMGFGSIKMMENSIEQWRAEIPSDEGGKPELEAMEADLPELEVSAGRV